METPMQREVLTDGPIETRKAIEYVRRSVDRCSTGTGTGTGTGFYTVISSRPM